LFIISTGKNIIKISQKNNAIVWVKKISTVPLDNFSFDEKYVYFNGINGTFYMLNYDTGKIEYIYLNANSTTILDVKKPVIHKNIVIVFVKNRVILFDKINKQILADEYCKNIENVVVSDDTVNIDGTMVSI
ncbi:MAG: hypothetical protein LBS34_00520, partial [Rickettsiales bacterium]|nr:hypothetical protein [Rickettsiales bacterium]